MKNKPKYSFIKNTGYALKGFKDIVTNETSFRIELILLPIVFLLIYLLDFQFYEKLFLLSSYILLLIVEAINSAIERVVDLVTLEYNELAGKAKDAGSTAVFLTIVLNTILWTIFIIGNIQWKEYI